jgi:hypothetical protein
MIHYVWVLVFCVVCWSGGIGDADCVEQNNPRPRLLRSLIRIPISIRFSRRLGRFFRLYSGPRNRIRGISRLLFISS